MLEAATANKGQVAKPMPYPDIAIITNEPDPAKPPTSPTNLTHTGGRQTGAAAPVPTNAPNNSTGDQTDTPSQRGRTGARDRSRPAARNAAKAEAEQADLKEAQRLLQVEVDEAETEEARRKKQRSTGEDGIGDMSVDSAAEVAT